MDTFKKYRNFAKLSQNAIFGKFSPKTVHLNYLSSIFLFQIQFYIQKLSGHQKNITKNADFYSKIIINASTNYNKNSSP